MGALGVNVYSTVVDGYDTDTGNGNSSLLDCRRRKTILPKGYEPKVATEGRLFCL